MQYQGCLIPQYSILPFQFAVKGKFVMQKFLDLILNPQPLDIDAFSWGGGQNKLLERVLDLLFTNNICEFNWSLLPSLRLENDRFGKNLTTNLSSSSSYARRSSQLLKRQGIFVKFLSTIHLFNHSTPKVPLRFSRKGRSDNLRQSSIHDSRITTHEEVRGEKCLA